MVNFFFPACAQYFPSLMPNGLIWVKKIDDVRVAREIALSPNMPVLEEESSTLETHLKTLMFSTYPLGAPFTIKRNSLVYPSSSSVCGSVHYTVSSCAAQEPCSDAICSDDRILERLNALHIKDNDDSAELSRKKMDKRNSLTEQSSLVPNAEPCQGESTFNSSSQYITLDEYHEGDSLNESKAPEKCFLTSTPNRKSDSSNDLRKSVLTPKNVSSIASNSFLEEKNTSHIQRSTSELNGWFRVGKDTKIIIKHSKSNLDAAKPSSRKDVYCKDSIYFLVMKILQNKLANSGVAGSYEIISM